MTRYIPIQAKLILNRHRFIDDWTAGKTTINLYRGCEHACVYCDGRAEKYQVEGDFGSEIRVKENAPQLLRKEFGRIKEPIIIMVGGGVGDLYQPAEKEFQLTRKILELILEFGLPCHILTKSSLILRDFELIKEINKRSQAIVSFSISSLNEDTCRIFEPKAGPPVERIEALRTFAKEGIPTGVWFMPLIPYICDDEKSIEQVVSACSEAGVDFILPALMTLKEGRQKDCFMKVLEAGFPDLVPIYHKIYRENKWGAPEIEYSAIVEERARNICHHYKMPTRIPYRLFKDRVSLRDEVALLLLQITYLLYLQGKKRPAYQRVAFNLQKQPYNLAALGREDRLSEVHGVGKVIASLIKEIVTQRRCRYYEELWEKAFEGR